jgi:hypothetical protein
MLGEGGFPGVSPRRLLGQLGTDFRVESLNTSQEKFDSRLVAPIAM